MSTPQVILENASYHSQILNSIAELDYVPSALAQQTNYLNEIELQHKQSEIKLKKLSETTKKERKEHEDLRDSTARRLAHKLTGRKEKFHERENKEERYASSHFEPVPWFTQNPSEYVEALEQELTERDRQNVLSRLLTEAKEVVCLPILAHLLSSMMAWNQNAELAAKSHQFESLKKELTDLYSRVFDGPTAGM